MSEFEQTIYKNEIMFGELISERGMSVGTITAISLTEELVNVGRLFVHPDHRNKKIAKGLHEEMLNWAKETGHKRIELGVAAEKGEDEYKILTVLEHFGYICMNPEDKGQNTVLCYYLEL